MSAATASTTPVPLIMDNFDMPVNCVPITAVQVGPFELQEEQEDYQILDIGNAPPPQPLPLVVLKTEDKDVGDADAFHRFQGGGDPSTTTSMTDEPVKEEKDLNWTDLDMTANESPEDNSSAHGNTENLTAIKLEKTKMPLVRGRVGPKRNRGQIIITRKIIRKIFCKICMEPVSSIEKLAIHLDRQHKIRVQGAPRIVDADEIEDTKSLENTSNLLQHVDNQPRHIEAPTDSSESSSAESSSEDEDDEDATTANNFSEDVAYCKAKDKEMQRLLKKEKNWKESIQEKLQDPENKRSMVHCDICLLEFSGDKRLSYLKEDHMRQHAQGVYHHCPYCSMAFLYLYQLHVHLEDMKVPIVPENYPKSEAYDLLYKLHNCPEPGCEAAFVSRKCLLFHRTLAHDGLHRCPTCEKPFMHYAVVRRHIQKAHNWEKRLIHCGVVGCEKSFLKRRGLLSHLIHCHTATEKNEMMAVINGEKSPPPPQPSLRSLPADKAELRRTFWSYRPKLKKPKARVFRGYVSNSSSAKKSESIHRLEIKDTPTSSFPASFIRSSNKKGIHSKEYYDKMDSLPPRTNCSFRDRKRTNCQTRVFSFVCSLCTRSFRTQKDKDKHMERVHHLDLSLKKPYLCPVPDCGTHCEPTWILRHVRTCHPPIVEKELFRQSLEEDRLAAEKPREENLHENVISEDESDKYEEIEDIKESQNPDANMGSELKVETESKVPLASCSYGGGRVHKKKGLTLGIGKTKFGRAGRPSLMKVNAKILCKLPGYSCEFGRQLRKVLEKFKTDTGFYCPDCPPDSPFVSVSNTTYSLQRHVLSFHPKSKVLDIPGIARPQLEKVMLNKRRRIRSSFTSNSQTEELKNEPDENFIDLSNSSSILSHHRTMLTKYNLDKTKTTNTPCYCPLCPKTGGSRRTLANVFSLQKHLMSMHYRCDLVRKSVLTQGFLSPPCLQDAVTSKPRFLNVRKIRKLHKFKFTVRKNRLASCQPNVRRIHSRGPVPIPVSVELYNKYRLKSGRFYCAECPSSKKKGEEGLVSYSVVFSLLRHLRSVHPHSELLALDGISAGGPLPSEVTSASAPSPAKEGEEIDSDENEEMEEQKDPEQEHSSSDTEKVGTKLVSASPRKPQKSIKNVTPPVTNDFLTFNSPFSILSKHRRMLTEYRISKKETRCYCPLCPEVDGQQRTLVNVFSLQRHLILMHPQCDLIRKSVINTEPLPASTPSLPSSSKAVILPKAKTKPVKMKIVQIRRKIRKFKFTEKRTKVNRVFKGREPYPVTVALNKFRLESGRFYCEECPTSRKGEELTTFSACFGLLRHLRSVHPQSELLALDGITTASAHLTPAPPKPRFVLEETDSDSEEEHKDPKEKVSSTESDSDDYFVPLKKFTTEKQSNYPKSSFSLPPRTNTHKCCQINCDRRFTSLWLLQRHMNQDHGDGPGEFSGGTKKSLTTAITNSELATINYVDLGVTSPPIVLAKKSLPMPVKDEADSQEGASTSTPLITRDLRIELENLDTNSNSNGSISSMMTSYQLAHSDKETIQIFQRENIHLDLNNLVCPFCPEKTTTNPRTKPVPKHVYASIFYLVKHFHRSSNHKGANPPYPVPRSIKESTQAGEMRWNCGWCGMTKGSRQHLTIHVLKTHPQVTPDEYEKYSKDLANLNYTCGGCGLNCKTKRNFGKHINSCGDNKVKGKDKQLSFSTNGLSSTDSSPVKKCFAKTTTKRRKIVPKEGKKLEFVEKAGENEQKMATEEADCSPIVEKKVKMEADCDAKTEGKSLRSTSKREGTEFPVKYKDDSDEEGDNYGMPVAPSESPAAVVLCPYCLKDFDNKRSLVTHTTWHKRKKDKLQLEFGGDEDEASDMEIDPDNSIDLEDEEDEEIPEILEEIFNQVEELEEESESDNSGGQSSSVPRTTPFVVLHRLIQCQQCPQHFEDHQQLLAHMGQEHDI